MIETDAHLTRDGEIVLIHDADLRRTTNCSGSIAEFCAHDLAACDTGYWFTRGNRNGHPFRGLGLTIPRLTDLLDLVHQLAPGLVVNVEIKNLPDQIDYDPTHRLASRLVNQLQDTGAVERVLVSSFDTDSIDCVKRLEPLVRTACLCGSRADLHARTAWAHARGHDAIHPHHASIGAGEGARRIVDVMHAAGLEVNVWTVNQSGRMLELAEAGVDGIITDDPEQLRLLLESRA